MERINENKFEEYLNTVIGDFSKNKQTQKVYRRIFDLLYTELYIKKNLNSYGHVEIHSALFKQISRKKYKDILIHMKKKGILWSSSNIGDNHLGQTSPGGKHIIRAYNFQRDFKHKFQAGLIQYTKKVYLMDEKSVPFADSKQNTNTNIDSLYSIPIYPLSFSDPLYSKGSTLFLTEKRKLRYWQGI